MTKAGLQPEVGPSGPETWTNFKSLLVAGKMELPDRKPLVSALKRTQSFYSKTNTLSIAHERSEDGHGDEADAVARMVMMLSNAGWIPGSRRSAEEEAAARAQARRESEYDPLTYALV